MKMNNKMKIHATGLIALTLVFLLTGCFGSRPPGATGGSVTVRGSIGQPAKGRAITAEVDKVWAIPLINGTLDFGSFDYKREAAINPDGTFSINLLKGLEWILLLIDSTAPRKIDQIVGYIALKDLDGSSLVRLPVNKSTQNTIDLGELSQEGDEAQAEPSLQDMDGIPEQGEEEQAVFNLTLDQLREMARTDDLLKIAKNYYANYNPATGKYITVVPWYAHYTFDEDQIKNVFPHPSQYFAIDNLMFGVFFFTNRTADFPVDQIKNHSVTIDLCPPEGAVLYGVSPDLTLPGAPLVPRVQFDGDDSVISSNPNNHEDNKLPDAGEAPFDVFYIGEGLPIAFNYNATFQNANGPAGEIPAGVWQLKKNGQDLLAEFELAVAKPFDAMGNPIIYIPSIRVTVNENNIIEQIDLKWYLYTEAGYIDVTESPVLGASMEHLRIFLVDYDAQGTNQPVTEEYYTTNPTAIAAPPSFVPTNQWKFLGDTTPGCLCPWGIVVEYRSLGTNFWFEWRAGIS